jgi:uncharacterized protein
MSRTVSDLATLLGTLEPRLHPGVFVFAVVDQGTDLSELEPVATFREPEGLSIIVEEHHAERAGLRVDFRAAWITLTVNSDLNAVGLTAAVAKALADEGISCNIVAAVNHDHVFVPVGAAEKALLALRALQRRGGGGAPRSA